MATQGPIRRGPKPSKSKKPVAPIPAEEYICSMCGSSYKSRSARNFPRSYGSPLWAGNGGYIPVCRSCLETLYENYYTKTKNENSALRRICMKFDYYFSPIVAQRAKSDREKASTNVDKDKSLIFYYLDIIGRQEYQSKTYDNTIAEESIARQTMTDAGDMDLASQYLEDAEEDDERNLNEDLYYFWGPGFVFDEYLFMQEEFEDWNTRYIIDTKSREQLVKECCKIKTLMNRALKENDTDQYSKLNDQWKKTMDAAELTPRAERAAAKQTEMPLGEMIQRFENEKPIPKPDPEWEDVDGIMKLIVVYFIGHLCAMLGIKNRMAKYYQEEMDKYRAKEESLKEADDEEVFDYIFGDGIEDAIVGDEDGK